MPRNYFAPASANHKLIYFCLCLVYWTLPADAQQADRGLTPANAQTIAATERMGLGHNQAILFATNLYDDPKWPPLVNPVPDAEAIAKELRENYGFSVEVVTNPTREQIVRKLVEYHLKTYEPSDQLFIFFAGHGFFDDVVKQGFIVARNSASDDVTRGTYESYDDLRSNIDSIGAKHILLIMDACFSGTFDPRVGAGSSRGPDEYANISLAKLLDQRSHLETRKFITSGGKHYVSDGVPGHHSPFAAHLLEALRLPQEKGGFLTFNALLDEVDRTAQQPIPGEWGKNEPGSDFLFIPLSGRKALTDTEADVAPPVDNPPLMGVTADKSRPSIAVTGFVNLLGKPADSWISTALSEWITTELGAGDRLLPISGEDLAAARNDLAINDSSGLSTDMIQKLRARLHCDYLVSGSYALRQDGSGELRLDLRLQATSPGSSPAMFSETGKTSDLTALAEKSAAALRSRLNITDATPAQATDRARDLAQPEQAAKDYFEGLRKLRSYDLLGARDDFEHALVQSHAFTLARVQLAKVWSLLGYDAKAREAITAALNEKQNLDLESRLTLEGEDRRYAGDWAGAAEIYSSLWIDFHDKDEYAIQLAKVQIDAGKPVDALGTITRLRAQSKTAAEDSRVDLAEALAFCAQGDAGACARSADTAAKKALKENSRMLAAEAYWKKCQATRQLGDVKAAEEACEKANGLADVAGGQLIKARSLSVLASLMKDQGNNSEATELQRQALRSANEIGSRKDIAGAQLNLANSLSTQGLMDEALANYRSALQITLEIGDQGQQALAQMGLGSAAYTTGDFQTSRDMYGAAAKTALAIKDSATEIDAIRNLAMVQFALGEISLARKSALEAGDLARGAGLRDALGSALVLLGDILTALDDLKSATQQYADAAQIYKDVQDPSGSATVDLSLASLDLEAGKSAKGAALCQRVVEEAEKEKDVDLEASGRETRARCLLAQGDVNGAQAEVQAAAALAPQDHIVRISLTITGARIQARTGNPREAARGLETAYQEARRLKLVGLQFEVRLAQADALAASDPVSAASARKVLASEARQRSYLLVARKAEGK